jgi:hypothetical protein
MERRFLTLMALALIGLAVTIIADRAWEAAAAAAFAIFTGMGAALIFVALVAAGDRR